MKEKSIKEIVVSNLDELGIFDQFEEKAKADNFTPDRVEGLVVGFLIREKTGFNSALIGSIHSSKSEYATIVRGIFGNNEREAALQALDAVDKKWTYFMAFVIGITATANLAYLITRILL